MVFVLGLMAIVFFVLGVALVFKSYADMPNPDQVVPVQDLARVQQDLASKKEEEDHLKQQLDALVLDLDNAKTGLEKAKALDQDISGFKTQIANYESRINELSQSLEYLRGKADQQAQDALVVLTSLKEQNETLKKEVGDKVDPALLEQLQKEKSALAEKISLNDSRVQDLERELEAARSQSGDKISEAQKAMSEMIQQNEQLRQDLSQVDEKIRLAQAEKEQELQAAQQELERLRGAMGEWSKEKEENAGQLRQLQEKLSQAEALPKATSEVTKPEGGASENDLKSLQDRNAKFLAREKLLQLELTRSRAQALGLERICADLKKQVKEQSSKGRETLS